MWPKFLNSKFFIALLTSVVTIISVLITQSFTSKRIDEQEIKNELKMKASIPYVDQRDNDLRNEFRAADQMNKENFQKSVDEINTNVREIRTYIMNHPK